MSELRQLLAALELQTLPTSEWQLVVCDDGSDEDLRAAIGPTGVDIRWLRQERGGPAAARNLGLYSVAAPIIAFTDSDCIPEPGWLESLIGPIETGQADVTGGLVGFDSAEQWIGRCLNFVMTTGLGAGGARDPRNSLGMRFFPRTGNMAVLRDLALEVSGFPNERYGEDVEFGRRLTAHGARVQFVPSAVVVHNEKRTLRQVGVEAYRKGAARIRLTQRYGFKELIHAAPAALVCNLGVLPAVIGWWPAAAGVLAVPLAVYLVALIILGIQGLLRLRDLRALVTVPLIAVVLHFGYGVGYWCAGIASLLGFQSQGRLVPAPHVCESQIAQPDKA